MFVERVDIFTWEFFGELDAQWEFVVGRRRGEEDLEFSCEFVGKRGEDFGDGGGKDVYAAHMHHVVAASEDAKTKTGTSTPAGFCGNYFGGVVGTVTEQGLCLAGEIGVDEFAACAVC